MGMGNGQVQEGEARLSASALTRATRGTARAIPSREGFLQQVLELLWDAGSSSGCLLPPRALLQAKMYLGHGLFSACSSLLLPQTILSLLRDDPEINVCYICCKAVAEPGLLPMYTI